MKFNPRYQKNLYCLSKQLGLLIDLYNKKLLSNKIIFSGPKGVGKSTLAYHLINYIFSKDEENSYNLNENLINVQNKSYKLIENRSHPNFYNIDLVDDKRNIEISQIREMINYANKSSFNNKERFVLIDSVENLNLNSLNALLKIIEEPNENLFFLLIHNSNKNISKTLKSRCISFNIGLTNIESKKVARNIIEEDVENILSDELINYYISPGDIVGLVKFVKENDLDFKNKTLKEILLLLINENYYLKDKFIKYYIFVLIQSYFLKLLSINKSKNKVQYLYNKFMSMSQNCVKYNLNYENLFMELKYKILNE